MGSSLGLALKKRGVDVRIHAYARRAETRAIALELGAVDAVFESPVDAVADADVVVVCVPIWSIADLSKQIAPALKSGAVVTDVGSTKAELNVLMEELFADSEACFVGSHPIAGSEKTGVEAGTFDLYEGRLTILCPSSTTAPEAKEQISTLWKTVGAEVVEMSAEQHDAMLASTSHLPHMIAAALARSVADGSPASKADFCGTGFKDTTRVASGSADMWVDIIDTNRAPLEAELGRFNEELQGLIAILRSGNQADIRCWLEEAAVDRDEILNVSRFLKS